jgi:hypothetical protein
MAPVAVEPHAGGRFCPKREGIGVLREFFLKGGIVGIFINLNGSLGKKSFIFRTSVTHTLHSQFTLSVHKMRVCNLQKYKHRSLLHM